LETDKIVFRLASNEDCELLWKWANDPEVRTMSFVSEVIAWEEHVQWFQTKIKSPNCVLWIAESIQQEVLGQVRFDVIGVEATISVSVDSRFRNKGYGSRIIRLATQKLFSSSNVQIVYAYIRPENRASVRAFINANFQIIGTNKVSDQLAIQMASLPGQ